jgi:hypothetical protein
MDFKRSVALVSLGLTLGGCGAVQPEGGEAGNEPVFDTVRGGLAAPPLVTAAQATVTVTTAAELVNALSSATPGTVIWIPDTAVIDLTGYKKLVVGAGVTIASSRNQGTSLGALIKNTENTLSPTGGPAEAWWQFNVSGDGARITGLRLQGPDQTAGPGACSTVPYPTGTPPAGWPNWGNYCAYYADASHGIEITGAADVIIDNNELFGWGYSAVRVTNSLEAYIYRNSIHHNRRYGLGYGVSHLNDASSLIENNVFSYNRHAIAGAGQANQRYEAKYNLVSSNPQGYSFDMHGDDESGTNPVAGAVIRVHRNTFRESNAYYASLCVRGVASIGVYATRNCAPGTTLGLDNCTSGAVFGQRYHTGGTYVLANNTIGTTTATCNGYGGEIQPEFKYSVSGTGLWNHVARYTYDTNEIGLGDFNGDGKTDVFRATGSRWYYSPGASGRWVYLGARNEKIHQLKFADFDGDGKTDVFTVNSAGAWYVSPGGSGAWVAMASDSSSTIDNVALGDFNGDGKADVFRATGSNWKISYGGNTSYVTTVTSSATVPQLGFGDFDGDGKTDVLYPNGTNLLYSSSATSSWVTLGATTRTIGQLRFGKFDADAKTDVFYTNGFQWQYSSGGVGAWTNLTGATCSIDKLMIGDFNGDGRSDVFGPRCSES